MLQLKKKKKQYIKKKSIKYISILYLLHFIFLTDEQKSAFSNYLSYWNFQALNS